MGKRKRKRRTTSRRHAWEDWPNQRLLDLRFCDLGISLRGTWVERCVARLHEELKRRGLRLRPHVWLSEEWYSPEGIPGIAIPFFLAHPRLARLERQMMLEVEGGSPSECLKLLRHEAGHAVQHGYQLQRRRKWQRLFGRSSDPYPDYYRPRAGSKKFVQHLDAWYAQSHPDEDFAETFAVWLKPRSAWRRRYRGWPALKKLEYVDDLMSELAGQRPKVKKRDTPYSVSRMRKTLRRYYEQKKERYSEVVVDELSLDVRRLFASTRPRRGRESAASFLRRHRRSLRQLVCQWTGEYQFTVDHILKEMINACQESKLRAQRPERELEMDCAALVTVHTMRCLYRGPGWHAL